MTPQTISSLLILFITSQEVFCQDDAQSQLLKRIEKMETEMKEKSDLLTEIITVKNLTVFFLKRYSVLSIKRTGSLNYFKRLI